MLTCYLLSHQTRFRFYAYTMSKITFTDFFTDLSILKSLREKKPRFLLETDVVSTAVYWIIKTRESIADKLD